MISYYEKDKDSLSFKNIAEPKHGCLLYSSYATYEDLKIISKLINIEIEDLEDCLDKHEIARIDNTEDVIITYLRMPNHQERGHYTNTISILIDKKNDYICIITPGSSRTIENMLTTDKKPFEGDLQNKTTLFIHILSLIVQNFTTLIKKVRREVLAFEKDIAEVTQEELYDLTIREEFISQTLYAIEPFDDVITQFKKGKLLKINDDHVEEMDDIQHANDQNISMCMITSKMFTSLRNNVQIIITNQFNNKIKLLTALTLILFFPMMISSLYGMNVSLPFEKSPHAFGIILVISVFISIASFYLFQKRRWL